MNLRILSGVSLLCVVALVLFVLKTYAPPTVVLLHGYGCGTKLNLLANSEVKRIMERNGIGVQECPGEGSIKICTDKDLLQRQDFVWPASLYAIDLCQKTLGRTLQYDVTFHSPIVFYSWDCVTRELVHQGLVEQVDGVYYIPDMQKFTSLILSGPSWQGACGLAGKLRVIPTDPTWSNSGSEFVALLATMRLSGEVPTDTTIESVLPDLKKYIDSLGGLETTSSKLFAKCIRTGMGECPIFALYESQGIDFIKQYEGDPKDITEKLRTLYPKPTVWAAHELIIIKDNAKTMLDVMKDKQVQAIAWRNHGFRTGYVGKRNPAAELGIPGVPESIVAVVPLPSPAVMDRITKYLGP